MRAVSRSATNWPSIAREGERGRCHDEELTEVSVGRRRGKTVRAGSPAGAEKVTTGRAVVFSSCVSSPMLFGCYLSWVMVGDSGGAGGHILGRSLPFVAKPAAAGCAAGGCAAGSEKFLGGSAPGPRDAGCHCWSWNKRENEREHGLHVNSRRNSFSVQDGVPTQTSRSVT